MNLTYNQFKDICSAKNIRIQYRDLSTASRVAYYIFAYDGPLIYETKIDETADIEDFEENYKQTSNQNIEARNEFGSIIVSPSFEDVMGLYPKKKMTRHHIVAGEINFLDEEITTERRINGGEFWIDLDDTGKVHKDDYVDFSIIDKNDVLGLFSTYGLTVGVDILELVKFVKGDIIKKGSVLNGYHSQLYEGIKGTNIVYTGIFQRIMVESYGTENYDLLGRMYYYE